MGSCKIALSNLSIYYTWKKNKKSHTITINLKYQHQHGMIIWITWWIIFCIIYFEYILKKHGENTDNPSVKIYVNKIKNGITFRIKNGFSLENLTPGAMKLRGSTKNKITKDINAENVLHFKIT